MKRIALVAPALLLVACASTTVPPPVPPDRDPWTRVTALERGVSVVAMIDCSDERLCEPIAASIIDGERVEGALAEVSADSALLRTPSPEAALVPIPREIVTQLFLVKPASHDSGVLIGVVTGIVGCAMLGGFTEDLDAGQAAPYVLGALCAAAGGGLGYLADSSPPTLVLIYERRDV